MEAVLQEEGVVFRQSGELFLFVDFDPSLFFSKYLPYFQLFQYLEPMTQECRWMSLMHRIETYPLPRQDGDIQYHIYKNGTAVSRSSFCILYFSV